MITSDAPVNSVPNGLTIVKDVLGNTEYEFSYEIIGSVPFIKDQFPFEVIEYLGLLSS